MPVTVTVTSVVKPDKGDGKYYVNFSDGTQMEFENLAAMKASIAEMDSDPRVARQIAIGWWLARSNDASNTNLITGKNVTFDLTAAAAIKVQ